jgi:hypothetical protein
VLGSGSIGRHSGSRRTAISNVGVSEAIDKVRF